VLLAAIKDGGVIQMTNTMTNKILKSLRCCLMGASLLAGLAHIGAAQTKRSSGRKPAADQGEVAVVTSDTAGIFQSPSSASTQLAELKKGDRLSLTQPSNGGSWYAVRPRGDGTEGWIESTSVRLESVDPELVDVSGYVASKRPPVIIGVPGGVPAGVPGGVPRAGLPGAKAEILGLPLDDSRPIEWKRYSPEGAQLSIDLPGEPHDMSQILPEFMKGSSMYATYRKRLTTVIQRLEMPGPVDRGMLIAGFTAMLGYISNGSEVKYEIVSTGPNATIIHGTASINGQAVEIHALISSKGTSAYTVATLFPQSLAATLRTAADRIINSVKLEPKPKVPPAIMSMMEVGGCRLKVEG
jgi:hypothetical protein